MAGDQVDKLIDPSTSDEGSSGAKTARSLDLLQCMSPVAALLAHSRADRMSAAGES
jgi:hypothetical protein